MSKRKEGIKCPKCGYDRWKTKIKHKKWRCRKCGYIKEAK